MAIATQRASHATNVAIGAIDLVTRNVLSLQTKNQAARMIAALRILLTIYFLKLLLVPQHYGS